MAERGAPSFLLFEQNVGEVPSIAKRRHHFIGGERVTRRKCGRRWALGEQSGGIDWQKGTAKP